VPLVSSARPQRPAGRGAPVLRRAACGVLRRREREGSNASGGLS